jgi:hypothetical protein
LFNWLLAVAFCNSIAYAWLAPRKCSRK